MKVNIGFAQYVATIEFKPFLGENIEKYQEPLKTGTMKKLSKA